MNNVLLIDTDSKIPNLALMKISAYHKDRGDKVGFYINDPDLIYASVIFEKNKHKVDGLRFYHPDAEIRIGGSGYDLSKKLPNEVEYIKPDYSLYPEIDYSMGFTTRGCIRSCDFCVVPKKEGKLCRWQHPKNFHDPKFDKIMLMDNNWLADKEWFLETSQWIINNDLEVKEHGMDARLLDEELCERIKELKIDGLLHFAWDKRKDERIIKEKIRLLEDYFDMKRDLMFYVYVDSDDEFESGLYRCRELKKMGVSPFVMYNVINEKSDRIRQLQRWANRKWYFWKCDYDDFYDSPDNSEEKEDIINSCPGFYPDANHSFEKKKEIEKYDQ